MVCLALLLNVDGGRKFNLRNGQFYRFYQNYGWGEREEGRRGHSIHKNYSVLILLEKEK